MRGKKKDACEKLVIIIVTYLCLKLVGLNKINCIKNGRRTVFGVSKNVGKNYATSTMQRFFVLLLDNNKIELNF